MLFNFILKKGIIVAKIRVNKKEDFEKAFRQFRMRCKREGILREYRDRQFYVKPSEKRKKKKKNIKKKDKPT